MCSHNHSNWQYRFKYQSPAKIRPRCLQGRDPRVTIKFSNNYNTAHTSYHLVFVLKEKIQMEIPMRESENISHQVTYSVLRDPCFILKYQVANIRQRETRACEGNYIIYIHNGLKYILIWVWPAEMDHSWVWKAQVEPICIEVVSQ